jgi:hypothetical protein
MSDLTYAGALAGFLDRESQTVKLAYMYPITRIELKEERNGVIVTTRIFIVGPDGRWMEPS